MKFFDYFIVLLTCFCLLLLSWKTISLKTIHKILSFYTLSFLRGNQRTKTSFMKTLYEIYCKKRYSNTFFEGWSSIKRNGNQGNKKKKFLYIFIYLALFFEYVFAKFFVHLSLILLLCFIFFLLFFFPRFP